MKEGENMKLIKRITAYLLTFSILLSIGSSVVAAAVAPVEQEYPAHEDPSQEMLTDPVSYTHLTLPTTERV